MGVVDPLDPEADPVERSIALDHQIMAVRADQVFTKRQVTAGFACAMAVLAFGFGAMFLSLRQVTTSTNDAVTHEIPGLKDQIADRDRTVFEQADVINQATDAILQLFDLLRANGIEPPEIVIRPPDDPGG